MNNNALWNHRCLYRLSWTRFEASTRSLAEKLRVADFTPDVIIGIAKGGLVPAVLLAHLMDVPQFGAVYIRRNYTAAPFPEREEAPRLDWFEARCCRASKVLVVDDIVATGETLKLALEAVRAHGPSAILTASLVVNKNGCFTPDVFALEVDDWILFPWESSSNRSASEQGLPVIDV